MTDFAEVHTSTDGIGAMLGRATATKSGSTITVEINGTVTTVQCNRDLAPAAGDILIVQRIGAQWFAICRVYTAAPAAQFNDTGVAANPATKAGTLTVAPVETRSYRSSGWRTDNTSVYQGQYGGWGNHTGSVFYGTGPRSLTGATVTSATVQVRRIEGGTFAAQPTTMRLVTESTRPAGAPTLGSTTSGPSLAVNGQTSFTIPTSWAQAMVDGTAGGLAFFEADADPYVRFAGKGDWAPAFTLTINWQRG